jgi:hypothetical protein
MQDSRCLCNGRLGVNTPKFIELDLIKAKMDDYHETIYAELADAKIIIAMEFTWSRRAIALE